MPRITHSALIRWWICLDPFKKASGMVANRQIVSFSGYCQVTVKIREPAHEQTLLPPYVGIAAYPNRHIQVTDPELACPVRTVQATLNLLIKRRVVNIASPLRVIPRTKTESRFEEGDRMPKKKHKIIYVGNLNSMIRKQVKYGDYSDHPRTIIPGYFSALAGVYEPLSHPG